MLTERIYPPKIKESEEKGSQGNREIQETDR